MKGDKNIFNIQIINKLKNSMEKIVKIYQYLIGIAQQKNMHIFNRIYNYLRNFSQIQMKIQNMRQYRRLLLSKLRNLK